MERMNLIIIENISNIFTILDLNTPLAMIAFFANIIGIILLLYTLLNIIKAFILTKNYTPVLATEIKEFKFYRYILFDMVFVIFLHLYSDYEFYLFMEPGKIGLAKFPHDLDLMFTFSYVIPILIIGKYIKDGIEKYGYKKFDDYNDILKKYNLKK